MMIDRDIADLYEVQTKRLNETTQETTQKTTQETTQELKKISTKEKIIQELNKEKRLSRDELATLVGVSANAVKQHLANLKKENRIIRVGSTKAGYWEVQDVK